MKRLLIISLVLVAGCSFLRKDSSTKYELKRWPIATTTPNNIGVVLGSYVDPDEACGLRVTQKALNKIKKEVPKWSFINPVERMGIFIVRSNTQPLPPLCKGSRCANTWATYPSIIGIPPTTPGWGYGGLTEGHIFLSYRGTEKKGVDWLIGLIAHEWGCHEAANIWTHGGACTEITNLVTATAKLLKATTPECEGF